LKRTLFLHLGPAKTGTSALQHVLRHHDGSAVLYPRVGLWADGSHHNLVLNFFADYTRPEMVREDAGILLDRIAEEARASDRNIVISSEILAGRRNLADFVQALQSRMGGEPLRVELLVFVREHYERAASLYNQRVKDAIFAEQRDPDVFLAEHAERLCYVNLLRRLRRSEFRLKVLSYHPAETTVARGLAHLGFAPHQIPVAPARNVSLSKIMLVATLMANRLASAPAQRERLIDALRGMPGVFAPPLFIFGAAAIAQAEPRFAADRVFLRRRFGVELPVPDLAGLEATLVIDEREFAGIAAAVQGLGDEGAALLDAVRPYVRAT